MAVHTHAPSRQECGEKIPQGDIRLGQEYNSRHGGRGAVAWRHLACICPRGQLIGSDHMTDREDGVKTGALLSALLYPSLFLTSPIRARRVVCGWTHSGDAQRVLALSALVAAARCARLFSRPSLLSNSINPGVTSCVNAQGYKVRLWCPQRRGCRCSTRAAGSRSVASSRPRSELSAACQDAQGANATPKPAARPDPMAWAPPAPTSKVANGKKRARRPSLRQDAPPQPMPQPPLPLPVVAGYIVEPPPQPMPLLVVAGYIVEPPPQPLPLPVVAGYIVVDD